MNERSITFRNEFWVEIGLTEACCTSIVVLFQRNTPASVNGEKGQHKAAINDTAP